MRFAAVIILSLACSTAAWDDGDLEVFDAVEEVNQNFYEFMGVLPEALPAEIKQAFKKLTLKLHPDKNDSPDADVQFRNLVSIHNILKDPGKREKYNEVLKNGLPNWRSAVYYYRHVRKMGLAEGAFILFVIVSFGQYAVGWAAYAEKVYTAQQILSSRGSRKQKKSGFDAGLSEIIEQLPRPTIKDTLPFQIPRFLWWTVTGLPFAVVEWRRQCREAQEEEIRLKKREEEEQARSEREQAALEAARAARRGEGGARKRRGFVPQERGGCLLAAADEPEGRPPVGRHASAPSPISGGLWTDDDLAELVRQVARLPGGAPRRWERIAEAMNRPVPEVTHMAAKLKDNCYKAPGAEPPPPVELPKKTKTRKEDTSAPPPGVVNWSQAQQKALEIAIAKHPKGGAGDRWEKIANSVPGKNKEECMHRCKYLSDLVKKQKQKEEEEQRETEEGRGSEAELLGES